MEYDSSVHSPPPNSSSNATASPPSKRKAGRKKFRETRHPFYRGVRERKGGKWVCEVREPGKQARIWLGTYSTPDMAARAHDVAAIALRGPSARLNFPDSAASLPRASSSSPKDIRAAAHCCRRHCAGAPAVQPVAEFVDEEALFNMPGLVDSMAEGLLLTPPAMKRGFDWDGGSREEEVDRCLMDLSSLWSNG